MGNQPISEMTPYVLLYIRGYFIIRYVAVQITYKLRIKLIWLGIGSSAKARIATALTV